MKMYIVEFNYGDHDDETWFASDKIREHEVWAAAKKYVASEEAIEPEDMRDLTILNVYPATEVWSLDGKRYMIELREASHDDK